MLDLETIALFIGHVIIADGQIHHRELAVLNDFISENNLDIAIGGQLAQIFADDDGKVSIDSVIGRLRDAGADTQEQALIVGLAVAYVDGYFDPYEAALFSRVVAQTGFDRTRFEELKTLAVVEPESGDESGRRLAHLSAAVLRPLITGLIAVSPEVIRPHLETISTRLLLAGPEYERAIKRCTAVAEVDFAFAERFLRQNNADLIGMVRRIGELTTQLAGMKELEEFNVKGTLSELRSNINERLIRRLERNREALAKKGRALRHYTVSFLGRTKSGKSTLHAVITGEGSEFIGVGRQRTTRYNRVYTWKRLRIIDTPGIGAPGGKNDEAIAESIVDESDVICYVVTNDAIHEAEFRFLELIRVRGKPVVVLLNIKENLEDERRLRIYLKEPLKWYTRTDERSIQGHINRITRYAETYYRSNFMPIYPVQLLAARMARDEAYQHHADTLYRSSRMQHFLDALRIALIDEGVLRRSQTMLDGTVHAFEETRREVVALLAPLRDLRDKLSEKQVTLARELERSHVDGRNQIEITVRTLYDALRDQAHPFASEHYNSSPEVARRAWEDKLKQMQFVKQLEDALYVVIQGHFDHVRIYLEEIAQDLDVFVNLPLDTPTIRPSPLGIDMRTLLGAAGVATGLAAGVVSILALIGIATGPIGLICVAAAFGFGLIKNLFDNKAKRVLAATENLYASLCSGLETQQQLICAQILNEFDAAHHRAEKLVATYLRTFIDALTSAIGELERFEVALSGQVDELNRVFAWRMLNFVRSQADATPEISEAEVAANVLHIQRVVGESFSITTPQQLSDETIERLSAIIQERVIVVAYPGAPPQTSVVVVEATPDTSDPHGGIL